MLLSTPTNNNVAFGNRSHRRPQRTPEPIPCGDSPMLTPSPLRRRPLFPQNDLNDDFNSNFLHSPFQSPNVQHLYSSYTAKPEPISADDAEGAIFLDSPTTSSRPIPTSLTRPLRTPIRRPALSVVQLNSPPSSFVGAGTKRKSTPLVSTPLRRHNLTPLSIHPSPTSSGLAFDRLAPLPPPKFSATTPQSKAETDTHLRSQTATLTRLRITDKDISGDEFDRQSIDSGCDVSDDDDDEAGNVFFNGSHSRPSAQSDVLASKGKNKDEEVAAISPGGHISKRRARSRPVSEELLESIYRSPSPHKKPMELKKKIAPSGPVPFPSNRMHRRNGSASSSSDMGSPLPRRRTSAGLGRPPKALNPISLPRPAPRPLNRVESATLFFGPPIPAPIQSAPLRTRTNSTMPTSTSIDQLAAKRPKTANRHSYAGPGQAHIWNTMRTDTNVPSPHSSPIYDVDAAKSGRDTDMEEEMFFGTDSGNESIGLCPSNSSFIFSVTEGTPSPRAKQQPQTLPKKYRPRDSGVVVSDDDDYEDRHAVPGGGSFLNIMPRASTSVNSIDSDADEGLVTPGVGPGQFSGWPEMNVRISDSSTSIEGMLATSDPDAFIMRALSAATTRSKGRSSTGADGEGKRPPGTPVKRIKTTYLNGDRPWQSAITHKVADADFDYGHGFGLIGNARDGGKKGKGKPRQSLPALPLTGGLKQWNAKTGKVLSNGAGSDTDDEEDSPSGRKEKERGRAGLYDGLGLGRPVNKLDVNKPTSAVSRTRWLMRRSSSGAFSFSSGSDSSRDATPTRIALPKGEPALPRVPVQYSPSKNTLNLSPLRSASGSSSSSASTLNSPSVRQLPIGTGPSRSRKNSRPSLPLPSSAVNEARRGARSSSMQRLSVGSHPYGNRFPRSRLSDSFAYEQPGRFERDFVELDEVGSGEFGKVIKVRKKDGSASGRGYAIKKSKRFEGVRHRLRLREEVDTLQHLSRTATVSSGGTQACHPNVLGYIDSWEEGEALYIQTELCELGNLSRFLWEYGRAFPKLDEGRVWKIFVDLSNGLRFIHDAGVIHLDIKPANIFITSEGRFKIGDFGMASFWPRPSNEGVDQGTANPTGVRVSLGDGPFEREGDKLYLAPEVLQGRYGKAADVFSLGMTMLETASNIVVPDQGEAWHRLRQEDFSLVDMDCSPELLGLVRSMMRTDPAKRVSMQEVYNHPVVGRARRAMESMLSEIVRSGGNVFNASPLGSVGEGFLEEILCRKALDAMDVCS